MPQAAYACYAIERVWRKKAKSMQGAIRFASTAFEFLHDTWNSWTHMLQQIKIMHHSMDIYTILKNLCEAPVIQNDAAWVSINIGKGAFLWICSPKPRQAA